MKKSMFAIVILLCFMSFNISTTLADVEKPPSILGETCILMDVESGTVLYENGAHKLMNPASTTKIMTAIVALEKGNLEDIVTTGKTPTQVEGSKIYLLEGEKLTLEQMLYGMMLDSGNDAAIAIAEHIGGDTPSFVKMMNEKAAEIGAKNTTFVNPTGLTEENHKTTAYDLALISRYALLNLPKFREIVSTKTINIPRQGNANPRQLKNLNKLLFSFQGADGVKTGYTSAAGRTLVASATRGGWQLLTVVMKSGWDEIWNDAGPLLDYGFENFHRDVLAKKGEVLRTEKVLYGSSDLEIASKEELIKILPKSIPITKKVELEELIAPIDEGDALGKLKFYQKDKEVGTVDLIAKNQVKRKIYTYWWFWGLIIALTIIVLFIKLRNTQRSSKA